jgi:hypothetical protein
MMQTAAGPVELQVVPGRYAISSAASSGSHLHLAMRLTDAVLDMTGVTLVGHIIFFSRLFRP